MWTPVSGLTVFFLKFSMACKFLLWLIEVFFFPCMKESKCLNMLSRALSVFLVLWFYNFTTVKLLRNSKTSTMAEVYFSPLQMNDFKKFLGQAQKCNCKSQINCIFLDSNMVSWTVSNGLIHLQNICVVSLPSKLLLFSCLVMSSSLQPSGLQHARLPCPSLSPGVCSYSCPLSWWCHPTVWYSVVPFPSFSKLGENKCWFGFLLLCHHTSATFWYIFVSRMQN